MTDLEGVAGVLNFENWCSDGGGRHYEKAQRLLTEEVNAAADGFFEGGAEEILVVDGHGYGGDIFIWRRDQLTCNSYLQIRVSGGKPATCAGPTSATPAAWIRRTSTSTRSRDDLRWSGPVERGFWSIYGVFIHRIGNRPNGATRVFCLLKKGPKAGESLRIPRMGFIRAEGSLMRRRGCSMSLYILVLPEDRRGPSASRVRSIRRNWWNS